MTISFEDIKQIGAYDPTPLGKIKVYAKSDLAFYEKTPKQITWENGMVARFPVKESKSTHPNYTITMNNGSSKSMPVFQVLKSLNNYPPIEVINFDVTDFVRPC
jgi:hypothetical protein